MVCIFFYIDKFWISILLTKLQLLKEQRKFVYKFGSLSTEKVRAAKKQYINKEILLGTLNSKI